MPVRPRFTYSMAARYPERRHHRALTQAQARARESAETRAGEAAELVEEFVLEALVIDAGGRCAAALMVPVATGGARLRVVAGGEPLLGQVPESQVVGSVAPAHLRGHPAGVDGVAEYLRPHPCEGDGERRDEELAVRVGAGDPLAAPLHAGQACSSAAVHPATEVHEALRTLDERGEQ